MTQRERIDFAAGEAMALIVDLTDSGPERDAAVLRLAVACLAAYTPEQQAEMLAEIDETANIARSRK